jgi:eukaryotic-like serine/threonine-protein kinase
MKPGPESTKDPGLSFEAILAVPEGHSIDRDTLKPEERALVSLTDGQRNVGDLLRLTGLSGFVVMRVLRSLRERGVLVQVGNSQSPATTGELAAISGTIGKIDSKTDSKLDKTSDTSEKKSGGDAVPAARDKEKERSGPAARKATQDLSEVIAQRVRLRTPMMPPTAKPAATSATKTEARPANTAPAAGKTISLNNAPTIEMSRPPAESRDESELFPGPPEPEPKVHETPRPAMGPLSRTVIGIPAVRINQDQASRPVIPGGKSSKPAAPSPNDTLVDAGPPVPVSDLSAVGGSESPAASFRVGNYDVITRIAQGGMGSIYLCRRSAELGFQRLFVLKAVRQHSAQTEAAIRSFQREARIGGLLAHPNVLSVIDIGNYQDQPFLILDYVDGASLSDLLADGDNTIRPAPSVVVTIFLDALRGLQRAHDLQGLDGKSLGLVHGDFSPHNILVGTDGASRLTDFGSARLTALPEDRAEGGSPLGKPSYMSPEQLQGEPIDHRTDIFSVGVALWTALTGQKLFTDPSYEKTVMNVLRKKIPPPSTLGAPPALDDVCLRALSRTPGGRYASAEEMAQDLLQAAGGAHLVASPHQVGRWVQQAVGDVLADRRRRVLAATATAVAPVRKARGGDTMVMETIPPRTKTPMHVSPRKSRTVEEITGPIPGDVGSGDIPEWPAQSSRVHLVLVAALAALFAAALAAAGTYTYFNRPNVPAASGPP